jgi:hypothetical protein
VSETQWRSGKMIIRAVHVVAIIEHIPSHMRNQYLLVRTTVQSDIRRSALYVSCIVLLLVVDFASDL